MSTMRNMSLGLLASIAAVTVASAPAAAQQQQQKPNIIFIMGDDIGWANVGVYNQGIMAGRTPNLDQLGLARHDVSPTTTRRRVVQPVAQISSQASYRSGRG